MYHAYYDASGTEGGDGKLCVAGLVSTPRKWARFERAWNAVLVEYKVSHFHMKDFTGSRRQFKGWAGKEARRAEFLHDLLQVIKRGIHKAFIGIIDANAFIELGMVFDLGNMQARGSYNVVACWTMMGVERWIDSRHPSYAVSHYHEKGDTFQSDILAHGKDGALRGNVEILPKTDGGRPIRPFEAADLIAWEFRRFLHGKEQAPGYRPRRSFDRIMETIPIEGEYLTTAWCMKIAETLWPRRLPPNTS